MLRILPAVLPLLLFLGSWSAHAAEPVETYPKVFRDDCRNGDAKLYDECGDQFEILKQAMAAAEKAHKVLVVSYGAEWCIWCHAFDAHLKGQYGLFYYDVEDFPPVMREQLKAQEIELAPKINAYASANIVVAHIDYQYAPNGGDVIAALGAESHFENSLPLIFSVKDGKFVAEMRSDSPEFPIDKRKDGASPYRGYNRQLLLDDLQRIVNAAR